jgi:hypothetical protein
MPHKTRNTHKTHHTTYPAPIKAHTEPHTERPPKNRTHSKRECIQGSTGTVWSYYGYMDIYALIVLFMLSIAHTVPHTPHIGILWQYKHWQLYNMAQYKDIFTYAQ